MKKFLFVVALGAFAACNSGKTEGTGADSTKMDSVKMDTTTKMAPDSTMKMDSTGAKMDTTTKK